MRQRTLKMTPRASIQIAAGRKTGGLERLQNSIGDFLSGGSLATLESARFTEEGCLGRLMLDSELYFLLFTPEDQVEDVLLVYHGSDFGLFELDNIPAQVERFTVCQRLG